jgi:hypothetical protein
MDFLGIFSSALLLFLLLLIVLNIYCIHAYYKLTDKINQIYFVIDSIRTQQHEVMIAGNNKKEINILPENFKHFYYPTSPSSLIEVSSDDNTTSSYETDSDDEKDDDDFDNCKIKNVHMSLDLDNLEDIHVLLLDEISNVEQSSEEPKKVVVEEEPKQLVVEEELKQVVVEKELKQLVVEEEPKQVVVEEELKQLVVEEEPKQVVVEEEPKQLVVEEELKQVVVEEEPKQVVVEENINEINELKELNFKPKKRESRKNMGDGDYKKMNLSDLRKYVIENNINIDSLKMKKPEILKAIEELKELKDNELKDNELKDNELKDDEFKNDEFKDDEFKDNKFKDEPIVNSLFLVDVVEEIL